MSQDEMPAGAGAAEAEGAPENTSPMPAPEAAPQEAARAPERHAPDAYAVGVRVLRIAPAWLLSTTAGFALLILLLSWMRAGEGAAAVAAHVAHNDARSSTLAAAPAARESSRAVAPAPAPAAQAAAGVEKSPEPADVPAPPAAGEPSNTAPAQSAPPTPAETPKQGEGVRAPEPAPPAVPADGAAKFTVQVGSFNNQSEANERVSALRAAGLDARSAAVEIKGRGTWHRVQVGRFADRAAASEGLAGVRAKGGATGAIVVPIQD